MITGQFKSNKEIEEQFAQTGETFKRTPVKSESLSPATRRAWMWVIGWLVLLVVLSAGFGVAITWYYGG